MQHWLRHSNVHVPSSENDRDCRGCDSHGCDSHGRAGKVGMVMVVRSRWLWL